MACCRAWTPLAVLAGSFAVATAVMSAFGFNLYGIGVLGVPAHPGRAHDAVASGRGQAQGHRPAGHHPGLRRLRARHAAADLAGLDRAAPRPPRPQRRVLHVTPCAASSARAAASRTRSSAPCSSPALAALISVPIGLLTAIYLVEYGRGRLARWVTFLVDVMTGIPSIVAGLFAYALFVIFYGPGHPDGRGRVGRAVRADDPGRRALQRGDAQAGAERAARGVVRARRPALAHHRQGGPPDGDRRHRHRHHAGDRPRHRRDRPAADRLRAHHQHEHQPVRAAA